MALLIFAPEATDPGQFEDFARKMYPEYTRLNVPTWLIGPALGGGPEMDRPADILKVWPKRTPIKRLKPDEFNPIIEGLATGHCVRQVADPGPTQPRTRHQREGVEGRGGGFEHSEVRPVSSIGTENRRKESRPTSLPGFELDEQVRWQRCPTLSVK